MGRIHLAGAVGGLGHDQELGRSGIGLTLAVDDTAPRRGPIALADLFDAALKDLVPKPKADALPPTPTPGAVPTGPASGDAFLFSGNRHETVPRRLFLDRRLTPLERNAWQVFRLMLNDDGVTAFPTYEQLQPWQIGRAHV